MTFLTKLNIDKKSESLQLPLVKENYYNEAKIDLNNETSDDTSRGVVIIGTKELRREAAAGAMFCVFIIALLMTSIGIIGGIMLYKQYPRASMHRFQGWCAIPYDDITDTRLIEPHFRVMSLPQNMMTVKDLDAESFDDTFSKNDEVFNSFNDLFKETFEILDNFEKILVSDFRDGRHSYVVHDFSANKTGIIDSRRCYVMQLNRNLVMEPDLFIKSIQGNLDFDYSPVRHSMHAIFPALEDFSNVGAYIEKECSELPTYFLEKQDGTIRKRSADIPSYAKFAQFAGNHIQEIDIVNINELLAYEEKNSNTI